MDFVSFLKTLHLLQACWLVLMKSPYLHGALTRFFGVGKTFFLLQKQLNCLFTLSSSYLLYGSSFYEQYDSVAWPLSLVIANLFLESFEYKALELAPLKPSVFKCYINDTFIVWTRGLDKLNDYLQFMNSLPSNIWFKMEIGSQGGLPFAWEELMSWEE